jgi:hypothetical protein
MGCSASRKKKMMHGQKNIKKWILIGGTPRNRSIKCEKGGCSRSKLGGNCIAYTFIRLQGKHGQETEFHKIWEYLK